MKRYQFEEIVFWLSFIAWMISDVIELNSSIRILLLCNTCFNFFCAIYYALKDAKKTINNKKN